MRPTAMSIIYKESRRPEPWGHYRQRFRSRLTRPFVYVEWLCKWVAWGLGQWAMLEVLQYCGTLSIFVGVIFYFAGANDRLKQKHYQAWQVINTAQGKGGSGGRIEALQDLCADGVPLVGVDLSDAFLRGVVLEHANLHRADLSSADMRNADLSHVNLMDATMVYTNLRGAELRDVRLDGETDATNADFNGADLDGVNVGNAELDMADLRNADLADIQNWQSIKSIKLANILGCKDAPEGFVKWAMSKGAVQIASDDQWGALIEASSRPSK